jgi:hypothetical protein
MESNKMSVNSDQKPKRRGRPPGSKNKKKKAASKTPGRPKIAGTSIEGTIKQLLSLPATAETKIRLIKAALDI